MFNIRKTCFFLGMSSLSAFVGCQGSVPTLGTMGPLSTQNPSRVPPPADGSFQVPGQYSPQNGAKLSQNGSTQPIGTGLAQAADAWHGLFKSEMQGAMSEVKTAASNVTQRVSGVSQQIDQSAQNAVGAVQAGYTEATRRIADDIAPIGQSLQNVGQSMAPTSSNTNSWRKPDGQ